MKFCDNCGWIVVPVKGQGFAVCRNCKRKYILEEESLIVDNLNSSEKEIKIIDDEQPEFRTTNTVICPKCGHNKAEWTIRQMRGGDEAPTEFYRCLNCRWVWRVNG